MGNSILQPSFAAGELSPSIAARVDLARYQTGLALCRNFAVMPYGGVRNRPGTVFINETKNNGACRLIRFQFNTEQAYALLFGDGWMRVYRNGGIVLNTSGPDVGLPFELATPYALADLPDLNFTQSADVMTLVHPSYEPRELSRLAHDSWSLDVISFVPSISAPTGLSATPRSGGSGDTTTFRYVITAVADGEVPEESLPSASASVSSWDNKIGANLSWSAAAGADYYNVYKDNNSSGIYGFVGRADGLTFFDNNISPTKTDTPPNGNNPFVGAGNYPGAVGYYQQRMVYAGSNNNPQTVWMSKTGNFRNFGYSTPVKDDDSITFTIAAREVNRIRHLLPLRELLALTTGGEWLIKGAETGLTPKTVQAQVQSYNGSTRIQPIVVGNSAVYTRSRGSKVASLAYTFEDDGFSGDDLTVFASHLLRYDAITETAWQQEPDSIIWCVLEDGGLLSLTYMPEQQLVAWARHDTDGAVESICSVPEGTEDALYLVVRRTIGGATKRYVERMASRTIPRIADAPDVRECFFVDCGLSYRGANIGSETMRLTDGTDWQWPEELTLTSSNASRFVAGDVGDQVHLSVAEGGDMIRLEIVAVASGAVATVRPIGVVPAGLRNVASTVWAVARNVMAGLGHLEGKTVSILADGNVHPQQVVVGGQITLQSHAATVHIGLPYTSDLQTLAINITGQETLFDKKKTVSSLTLLVEESRGLFAGRDADHLDEFKPRDAEDYDDPAAMQTGTLQIHIDNDWEGQGQVFIRQEDPLPLTILGIIPELTVGGKS